MLKSRYKFFKLYYEDIYGRLIFNTRFSRLVKELISIYYDRRLRYKDYRRKGISFRIDIRHPKRYFKKRTFLGRILINRHKLRRFYGNLRSYQLRRTFYKSLKLHGIFANNSFGLLESRLDVVMYRANLGITYEDIRQLIIHSKLCINDKVVNIPSICLHSGDKITVHDDAKSFSIRRILMKYNLKQYNKSMKIQSKAISTKSTRIYAIRKKQIIRLKHIMKRHKYINDLKMKKHTKYTYLNNDLGFDKYLCIHLIRLRMNIIKHLNNIKYNINIINIIYNIQKRNIKYLYTLGRKHTIYKFKLLNKIIYFQILCNKLKKKSILIINNYIQLTKLLYNIKTINKCIIQLKLFQFFELKTYKKLYKFLYTYRAVKRRLHNKFINQSLPVKMIKKFRNRPYNLIKKAYNKYNTHIFVYGLRHKQFKHKTKLMIHKTLNRIFHKLYKMRKLRYRTMKYRINNIKKRNYYRILHKRKWRKNKLLLLKNQYKLPIIKRK